MADDTLRLTDQEVLEYARTGLQNHLPLEAAGYKCSTQDLWNVLLGVAVNRDTIESVCAVRASTCQETVSSIPPRSWWLPTCA